MPAPLWSIKLVPDRGGDLIDAGLDARVLRLKAEDSDLKSDHVTLTIENHDLDLLDSPLWQEGAQFEMQWGHAGNMVPPRTLEYRKKSGMDPLTVHFVSKNQRMNRQRNCRCWENVTRSDIVKTLAAENGFEAIVEETDVQIPSITQARLTDWQFIRQLARKEGFTTWVENDDLHWHSKQFGKDPLYEFTFRTGDAETDVEKWSVTKDITRRPGKVVRKCRDPLNKKTCVATASKGETSQPSLAEGTENPSPDEARSGEAVSMFGGITKFEGAITDESTKRAASSDVGPEVSTSEQELKRKTDGKFRRRSRRVVHLKVTCTGRAEVIAKAVCTVGAGFLARYAGNYYTSSVTSTLDMSGWGMVVSLIRDGTSERRGLAKGKSRVNRKTPKKDKNAATQSKDAQGRTQFSTDNTTKGPVEKVDKASGASSSG